jgi:eukaryotic-like serine/threonine-protein kinase
MLQTLYGTDGTKFKNLTINDDELMPTFTAEVKVPNLIGMTKEEADKALKALNLKVGKVTEEVSGDATNAGKVIKQSPAADSTVASGGEVDVTIAKIAS